LQFSEKPELPVKVTVLPISCVQLLLELIPPEKLTAAWGR
jgi:hypothetical protein